MTLSSLQPDAQDSLNSSSDCFSRLFAITPLKLGTANTSINNSMKMARAISINVKPRARCTAGNYSFHRKSQQCPTGHFGLLLRSYVSDAAGRADQ